jgi:hypothetical protein
VGAGVHLERGQEERTGWMLLTLRVGDGILILAGVMDLGVAEDPFHSWVGRAGSTYTNTQGRSCS